MVPYFGDFAVNSTVYIPINTFDSNDPAASVTVTNLANTDVHIHKDGGTTQRNNAAGITMSIDYDSITGNHLLTIDTSDTTVADFWQAGHEYQVRVEGITVDGGTINAWVGAFSIERSDTTAPDNLELMYDGTGYAGGTTKLDVNVVTIAANAITAASINADAITNAKIADNAIAAENLAADCITSAKIADNAFANEHFADGALTSTEITSAGGCVVASIANNAITANAINNDAITAAKIANGAIDAATFAADVDAEIATMVWNAATASYGGAGTYGQAVEDVRDDTNELQTDWHDGGRLDLILDAASAPSAAAVADAVWDEALAGHAGAGSAGAALTAAGSAGDPWATLIPGSYGDGTAGKIVGGYLDAAISTRLATAGYTAPPTPAQIWSADTRQLTSAQSFNLTGNITGNLSGSVGSVTGAVGSVTGAVGSVTGGVTVTTNNDKTGYSLASAPPSATAIREEMDANSTRLSGLVTELGKVPKSDSNVTWNNTALGSIQTKCGDALAAYDPPTNAEMEARTIASANYATASNLSTTDGKIDSIKTKTDSLTFTKSGEVDSNIKSINGTTVTGDGGVTPWGP